jgi:hypothetical protein
MARLVLKLENKKLQKLINEMLAASKDQHGPGHSLNIMGWL